MQTSQQLNKPKPFRRATFRQRAIAGLVFLAAVVFFGSLGLAAHYNITPWAFPCGFKQQYNLPCPSCGITTSALAFGRGKFLEAFYIQPAAALLCSLLAVSAFLAFLIAVFGVYFSFLSRFFSEVKIKYIILALIIVVLAGWAVTLARALVSNQG